MINTTAKYLLEDIDFSGEGAHLAMTLNEFGGSAAKARDEEGAYLYKSDNLPQEAKDLLLELQKSEIGVKDSPEDDLEKSEQGNKDSDAMSESDVNEADIGINKNNKEDSMATLEDVKVEVDVTKSEDLLELQKSMKEMQDLLKAEKEAREAAEAKADEIAKAAEQERVEKAKADLTDVVKGWDIEKCEGVSQEALVEALFKSEEANVILKAMDHLNERIETLKSEFGKEEGLGGEIKTPENDLEKTRSAVSEILEKNKIKAQAAKAGK